ncbi:MAG TPA: spermidine synthase [Actinophytocola sp.]|uniref:spermidine synthase n=1 Tax=Actinophytocola sp. TaxID=1872138 RepID=UPI002DB99B5B|nr:spermidine synthase [Actinophytocola sp.]HEU5473920.1 spermidine synthase [Actinophytocola sp.]
MAYSVDRRPGVAGELVLRRSGEHFEIIANGTFLMDTRNGESERLLVRAAADVMPPGAPLLIGGLGVGFSLRAALDHPNVGPVTVVEREPAVIAWNTGPLAAVHDAALTDPRVTCVEADLITWLPTHPTPFAAICLDIDNGPEWTVTPGNAILYTESGLTLLRDVLTPTGTLAIWSAADSTPFTTLLRTHFPHVTTIPIPVPRGDPDVIFLARR